MKEKIVALLTRILPRGVAPEITVPEYEEQGHYSTNVAFKLAKDLKKSPLQVADELIVKLQAENISEVETIKNVNGYINFFLKNDYLQNELLKISKNENFGKSDIGGGKKIIIEYSQPNIAKKLHAGHLRNTILGAALANIYEYLGYKVIRWNYLGDWGTQFGKVIAAYKKWGKKEDVIKNPIQSLLDLYIKFNTEAENNPELEKQGQDEFKKLENGDSENLELWKWFREESIKNLKEIYARLDVQFDNWISESFYNEKLSALVEDLEKKGITKRSEGALIVDLEKENLPPALIQKSDGASLYLTRDIANLIYRLEKYKPEKILYVVGNEQSLHFEQLFAVAKLLGITHTGLEHVKYGLVLGEDKKKLSTRKGKVVSLEGMLKDVIAAAKKIVEEKNPNLKEGEKNKIAKVVGIGALKYHDLKEHRNSDIIFDPEGMVDFRGNSGPYLQYTYTRLMSIMKKYGIIWPWEKKNAIPELKEPIELSIIKKMVDFPDVLKRCGEENLTNPLALYLYELANLTNKFYEATPILKDKNKKHRLARMVLIKSVAEILKKGLRILGIKTLEKI